MSPEPLPPDSLYKTKDLQDVIRHVFKAKSYKDTGQSHSNLSLLPSIGYNPSYGLDLGLILSGGKNYGDPSGTTFSIFNANVFVSSNGLASAEFKHNDFTNRNEWNLQGDYQVGRTISLDYGLGTGRPRQADESFVLNGLPVNLAPGEVPIQYTYFKFFEKVYHKIIKNFYGGMGFIFDGYGNIYRPGNSSVRHRSYNAMYSLKNGYPLNSYWANGILFNLQYNTRDHPNRPYKGIYADLVLRLNSTVLGSNHDAMLVKTELRKYWSLSEKNPEHVLAFWSWGEYLLNGSLPYLELPGTGGDDDARGGRPYTIGRFKGRSFYSNELEYRYPITENKLLSGIVFINAQTGSNQQKIKLLQRWNSGEGLGLRLLLNKYTRSNISADYGIGNYGTRGLFIALNETF
ncbi:BamA/TamA family outer membrane protein [Mucilaginibacter sp. L3T2-6]|uniref:BamA/TamA family outer membrane protein n=1 Tax=Mucilaginibacter sp. L3T2-6 TaxID=3062491 RepID=UPI00294B0E82|nr:BamA/TamA family outer membrane protein [Mucilaginibacter sp. L3T2-6]